MKKSPAYTPVVIGAVTALFFLTGFFLSVPGPVPGMRLPLHYGLLGVLSAAFGPLAGLCAGLLGRFFLDLAMGSGLWWSWIAVSGVFGLLTGLAGRRSRFCRRPAGVIGAAAFILFEVVANFLCWAVLCPVLDAALYRYPYGGMLAQGIVFCALSAAVTAAMGVLALLAFSAFRRSAAER